MSESKNYFEGGKEYELVDNKSHGSCSGCDLLGKCNSKPWPCDFTHILKEVIKPKQTAFSSHDFFEFIRSKDSGINQFMYAMPSVLPFLDILKQQQINLLKQMEQEKSNQINLNNLNQPKMSTKCIVIGQAEPVKKELKKIEFIQILVSGTVYSVKEIADKRECNPFSFENIELIKKVPHELDIMFVFNKDRNKGYIYLGHWNDGIV